MSRTEEITSHMAHTREPIHVRAKKLGIDSVTKTSLHTALEKARKLALGVQAQALRDVFGPDLDILQQPGAGESANNFFTPFLNDIFNKECNRRVICEVPFIDPAHTGESKHKRKVYMRRMQEEAVPIYTRTAFISRILRSEENIRSGRISIGRIDLERFRDADFDVGNPQGIRPADVMINTTARIIDEVLREEWKRRKLGDRGNTYEVGRYGGDEFMVAFTGNKAQVSKTEIMELVRIKLAQQHGIYKNKEGIIEERPIAFKKDEKTGKTVEWIEFPLDRSEEEKTMYREYLQRGLILNDADFEREKKKYSPSGTFNFQAYRSDYPPNGTIITYPDKVKETKEKGDYLASHYPEFALYFGLAELFDKEDSSDPKNIKRQEKLLAVIENLIFDRLLGEMIYSRHHFIKHMDRGEMGELHVFDYKNLKEKNTVMTYADADNSIKMLWSAIKMYVPETERHKMMVGRFGGAICIGVRKGEVLSESCKTQLAQITKLPFDASSSFVVPLGRAYLNLESEENKGLNSYQLLAKCEAASDRTYYKDLVQDILRENQNDPSFMIKVLSTDPNSLIQRGYQVPSKIELYSLIFGGKRKTERLQRMIDSLDPQNPLIAHIKGFLPPSPHLM